MTEKPQSMTDKEDLAHRLRAALGPDRALREVSMFGGLCFMVNEKLALGAMSGGELLVKVDATRSDELLAVDGARQAEMGAGRSMGRSWIAVSPKGIVRDADLEFWVGEARAHNAAAADPS